MDTTGLAIRKLIEAIAAKRNMSVEDATAGILWALEELLRTDKKPEDALGKTKPLEEAARPARKELGDEAPISPFVN
jgi:hypothetical protein